MSVVSGNSWRATATAQRRSNRSGFALEATLIVMVLISALILAAMTGVIATQRTTTVDTANAEALLVAEGGADAVMGQLSSYMSDGFISDAELGTITTPTVPGWTYEAITATKIGTPVIQTIAHGDYAGLVSYNQQIDLHVKVRDTRNNRGDVIITADAQAIPVFQFGVFYDNDLEILPGAAMTFEGWVHTNGDLYLTAASSRFMSLLTTPDSLFWNRKDACCRLTGVTIDNAAAATQALTFDSRGISSATFVANSHATFDDRVRTKAYGVAPLRLPLPLGIPPHTIVEPRVVGVDNQQTKDVKFAWKADWVIKVNLSQAGGMANTTNFCNNLATFSTRDSSFNALPSATECKNIFHWTTNAFKEGREDVGVDVLDIRMDSLRIWTASSWNTKKTRIMYISFVNPTVANEFPAIRILNATQLPGTQPTPGLVSTATGLSCGAAGTPSDYGFSLGTNAPVYLKGDYNWDGNVCDWKPSSIAADAITIMSDNWSDASHTAGSAWAMTTANPGADNTINIYAAIAAGNSGTPCDYQRAGCSSPPYGGGLENFPRFVEDWASKTVTYRGSLVSFFFAQQANLHLWSWRSYYGAPVRDWRFDMRFQNPSNLPPGTPLVGTVMQLAYRPVY